jgi:hypothetical protein
MALEKSDFDQIEKIVEKSAEKTKVELRKEIGLSRLDMNQRFDKMDKKIDGVESNLLGKFDEFMKMESEDIQAIYGDIGKIKKRLPV